MANKELSLMILPVIVVLTVSTKQTVCNIADF